MDEWESLLGETFLECVQYDDVFRTAFDVWPQGAHLSLVEFWESPQWADLKPIVSASAADWVSFEAVVGRLLAGGGVSGERWQALVGAALTLPREDPLVRCVVAFCAAAGYYGSPQRSAPAWYAVVVDLARVLLDSKAFHGARLLVGVTLLRLQADLGTSPHESARVLWATRLADIQEAVGRAFADAYAELAWELWTHCSTPTGTLRAEVAALFWTRGDVMHSEFMRNDEYRPPFSLIRRMVSQTVHRIPEDPLLQFIWLEIKQREVFPMREHRILFHRIDLVYRSRAVAQLEATPFGLDAAFARTVVAYFRGPVPEDLKSAYVLTFESYFSFPLDVPLQTRIVGLRILLDDDPSHWADLAARAGAYAQAQSREGSLDDYDTSLDIPFFYLFGSLEERLDGVEEYRCHAQWRWLRYRRLGPPDVPPEAEHLLDSEQAALRNVRDALHKRAFLRSVGGRQFDASHFEKGGPLEPSLIDGQLESADEQLERAWEHLEAYAPSYVNVRRNPVVPVGALAVVLQQHRSRQSFIDHSAQRNALIELARAAPTSPPARGELESRLESLRLFTLATPEADIALFSDPLHHDSEHVVIWLFFTEAELAYEQSRKPELASFRIARVPPMPIRRALPASVRIAVELSPDVTYNIQVADSGGIDG